MMTKSLKICLALVVMMAFWGATAMAGGRGGERSTPGHGGGYHKVQVKHDGHRGDRYDHRVPRQYVRPSPRPYHPRPHIVKPYYPLPGISFWAQIPIAIFPPSQIIVSVGP